MIPATAIAAEADGRIEHAASEYEAYASTVPADLEAVLNLIVLYWQCTDYGFSTAHKLSATFIDHAARRLKELSDDASLRFGGAPQVAFWRSYIHWADFGEGITVDDCRNLLKKYPDYLEPAVFLFAATQGAEGESECQEILGKCEGLGTVRCQYLVSVIHGVIKRRRRPRA
jgi:hypothetical protein